MSLSTLQGSKIPVAQVKIPRKNLASKSLKTSSNNTDDDQRKTNKQSNKKKKTLLNLNADDDRNLSSSMKNNDVYSTKKKTLKLSSQTSEKDSDHSKSVLKKNHNNKSSKKSKSTGKKSPIFKDSAYSSREQLNENLIHVDEWISPIQNLFLWFVSAIYMFAFFSFYHQVRGLYGNNGVLPLRYFAMKYLDVNESQSLENVHRSAPSLVWYLASTRTMSLTSALEFISLGGTIISFLQLLYDSLRGPIMYFLLFTLYSSCVNVGQTFLYFQWDAFLLEVGALTILISIRWTELGSQSFLNRFRPYPSLVLWTARWLLFKFMLSSGIVKFTARCPLWWSLRALDVHFESQPLPTPLAWYAHQLPQNWLHLAVVIHFVIEIVGPFFFFSPFRSLKILSFASQVFLQIAIALTGNYNFFNMLTIFLCFTLLDDDMFRSLSNDQNNFISSKQTRFSEIIQKLEIFVFGTLMGILSYYTVYYFDISFESNHHSGLYGLLMNGPSTKVNFTYDEFSLFVTSVITTSMLLGLVSFICTSLYAIYKSCSYGSLLGRMIHLVTTLFYVSICALILALSMVPLSELEPSYSHMKTVPSPILRWYQSAQQYHIMSSYGLFRTMTGNHGRPELVIEGSNDPNTDTEGWRPYYFKYKPIDLYQRPIFSIPHQPRLDWQMWFAALGTYQDNPWIIHLCYRLLTGEPDVLELLDRKRLPFTKPPKFIRISQYLYKFTNSFEDRAWWQKVSNRHAYLPMVTKETLESALKLADMKARMPKALEIAANEKQTFIIISTLLNWIHSTIVLQLEQYLPPFSQMFILILLALLWNLRCSKSSKQ